VPTAELNGTTIWYDTTGPAKATPIVAVHGGLGFDHLYMERSFSRLAGRFRMVFPDLRGNGQSGRPPRESITMAQLADDIAALLDHLGVDRAIVLGHSYGGFVAQEFALRHLDRLRALALIDTTPGQLGTGEREDDIEPGPPPPPEMIAAMSSFPTTDEDFEAGLPLLLPFYLHEHDAKDLEALHDGTVLCVDAMVRGFEILANWSSVDRLHTITAPTLVVARRHDLFTSFPQAGRIASRIAGAEQVIIEDAGHFPWVERPDTFFAVLDDWLARVG
jgi:proline iminopeptidase